MSFVHAFSILMSLKNKDLKNDFKFFFSVLLMSFGVGCKLMNMLSKMGFTYHLDTISSSSLGTSSNVIFNF